MDRDTYEDGYICDECGTAFNVVDHDNEDEDFFYNNGFFCPFCGAHNVMHVFEDNDEESDEY